MNGELDSKLLLYINKIKKANNTDKRNNLSDINKYLKKNISERKYDDDISYFVIIIIKFYIKLIILLTIII